ncbi:MAG: hypothetical protein ABIP13_11540 [Tepidiformaceae bacterium]
MTTRESLHQLVEEIDDEQLEELARLARESGLVVDESRRKQPVTWIDSRDYPVLSAIWDNDDDTIFDTM